MKSIAELKNYLIQNPPQKNGDYNEIARQFGFTPEAVRHHCRRLGLTIKRVAPTKSENIKIGVPDYVHEVLNQLPAYVEPLTSIQMNEIKQSSGSEEQMVELLSDWQLGHKTISFNYEVAKKRVQRLLDSTLKIANIHRASYPINTINLFLLGDFIQSESVGYLVDLSELEGILIDQVFQQAVPLLVDYIQNIAQYFQKVNVYCTRGNHGRLSKGSSEKTNWDDVIYKTLEIKFQDDERIHFDIAREFYQVVKIWDWKFLLTHGDQVRGGSYNIPLYALLQRMLRWATAMPFKWNTLCVGHWHNFAYLEQNQQFLIVNGTLVSDDEYVRKSYGWNASTSQVLFSVHPRRGITWMYKLNLMNDKNYKEE